MQSYQHKGDFHRIYENFEEFRNSEPFAAYHKYYWHLGILKEEMWTSTADGYIVQVLQIKDNAFSKSIVYPFKTIRVKSKWNEATQGNIWVPQPKLYYNKLLEKTIKPVNKKLGGITRVQMDDILIYLKLTGDIFKAIRKVVGTDLTSSQLYAILEEIEAKEPHIMDEMKSFVAGVDDLIEQKTGKTTEKVIQQTVADLLTSSGQFPSDKRANVIFYLKLKYMTPEQLIGIAPKGKNLKGIPDAVVVPPLLQ